MIGSYDAIHKVAILDFRHGYFGSI